MVKWVGKVACLSMLQVRDPNFFLSHYTVERASNMVVFFTFLTLFILENVEIQMSDIYKSPFVSEMQISKTETKEWYFQSLGI